MKLINAVISSIACLLIFSATCPADFKPGKIHSFIDTYIQSVCLEEGQALELDSNGKITCECVIGLLDSPNHRVRAASVYALGEIRDPNALKFLMVQLEDNNQHMRRAAARALGKLQAPEAVEPLMMLAKNHNENALVRSTAIRSLGIIGDQRALNSLMIIAKNENRLLKTSALIAMARINGETYTGSVFTFTPISK